VGEQDVIVIGAGHNGLTCAAYLTKAGKRVLVLEANPHVGGFCLTQEIPGAPGYRMNTYGHEFPFTTIRPSVVDELELSRFGLEWVAPDPHNTYLSPQGVSWSMFHDLDRTCESIARLSQHDAEYYARLMRPIMDLTHTILPYLMDHPTRPSMRTMASLIRRAVAHRKSLLPGARAMLCSPLQLIDGFEREEIKAYFALNTITGTFQDIEEPLNTGIFLYFAMMHLYPLQRPVGGTGAFAEALAACVRAAGGEVRTSSPVQRVVIRNGKATGVVLQNGEEFQAKEVVSSIDPTSLFTRLMEKTDVPTIVQEEVRLMQVTSNNVSHFKADLALSRRPTFPRHALPDSHIGGGISIAPSVEFVQQLQDAIRGGEIGDKVPFYMAIPSVQDRTMVPPGSQGDVAFIWCGAVPHTLSGGRSWLEHKQFYLDKVLDHIEEYSPGFRDSIIAVHTNCPAEFNQPWVYRGSSRAVDLVPSQTGPWRPSPSLGGYRTPIGGLWLTGHGTHPMSGYNGWPGRNTARTMLK
jgi:beta-carotene ketolase (CrtO type)